MNSMLTIDFLIQSPTQAWSSGCLIDLYMDAAEEQAKLEKQSLPLR